MEKIIIAISYILVVYFFIVLIKLRKEPRKPTPNRIYVLIVLIFVLLVVWSIFRNLK